MIGEPCLQFFFCCRSAGKLPSKTQQAEEPGAKEPDGAGDGGVDIPHRNVVKFICVFRTRENNLIEIGQIQEIDIEVG